MAEFPVQPIPAQPVPPTIDNLLRVYIAARGPSRAEYMAMDDTLTRLAVSLTEVQLEDLIKKGLREEIKDLAMKANVDEIVKVSCETALSNVCNEPANSGHPNRT
jgi:hypothetical protein